MDSRFRNAVIVIIELNESKMYSLSKQHHDEFLAIPELVRATMTLCASGFEPTILIKTLWLSLKFLIRSRKLRFVCLHLPGDYLAYGVKIDDDPDYPGVVWSALKTEDERTALRSIATGSRCIAFLFNELAVNVACAEFKAQRANDEVVHWINHANLYVGDDYHLREIVGSRIDAYAMGKTRDDIFEVKSIHLEAWAELRSTYITNRMKRSDVSVLEENEGGQQEEIALWLIDALNMEGAAKNPIVYQQTRSRELADLLLCHRYGTVVFESKSLAVVAHDRLPTRRHMSRALYKHIAKAERQLRGAIRSIRRNYRIEDETGREIKVESDARIHAIVLVPDLALLSEASQFGGKYLEHFFGEYRCVLADLGS